MNYSNSVMLLPARPWFPTGRSAIPVGTRSRRRRTGLVARDRGCERGQGLVEFAVLLPLLVLMTLGAADFARLFSAEVRVANAAREGARFGARHPYDAAGMRQRVLDELGQAAIGAGDDTVTAITTERLAAPSPPGGSEVRVTVTYRFALVTPVPLGARTFTFTTAASMLVV